MCYNMWWTYRQLEKIKKIGVFFQRCVSSKTSSSVPFKFKRALLVSKITKYDLEHYHNSHLNNQQIESWLRRRGSDFESLTRSHNLHKKFEKFLVHVLEKMNVEIRIVNRLNYSEDDVDWCDIVIPVGGDGTFLVAANHIRNNIKPIVGFNSDPLRSEGFLCLKKIYSSDVELAFHRIFEGKFSWLIRSRIRITLKGLNICEPVLLNEKEVMFKSKSSGFNWSQDELNEGGNTSEEFEEKILPYRALNEVFIGECLSARVSYFDLQLPNRPVTKVRSSGLCICTGTGSSSWYYSMNRLDKNDVRLLFKMADVSLSSGKISEILDHYNDSLVFAPDHLGMVYTIRDLISAGVWPDPPGLPSRGICHHITVRSKCIDGGLVIDGGLLYPFNDGMIAELEVHPEDALRTVILD